MKLYAIMPSVSGIDRKRLGPHGFSYLNLPGGNALVVCEPREYAGTEAHFQSLGATVFPELAAGEAIGSIAAHPGLSGAGLEATHTSYQAAKKLMAHFGWPALDPRT